MIPNYKCATCLECARARRGLRPPGSWPARVEKHRRSRWWWFLVRRKLSCSASRWRRERRTRTAFRGTAGKPSGSRRSPTSDGRPRSTSCQWTRSGRNANAVKLRRKREAWMRRFRFGLIWQKKLTEVVRCRSCKDAMGFCYCSR